VKVAADGSHLRASVENDGNIADPLGWKDGYGLRNIRGRLEELGGNLNISTSDGKVQLKIAVPLV
jgi:signal transduction histidine kinase